jgi:hypothetical protein
MRFMYQLAIVFCLAAPWGAQAFEPNDTMLENYVGLNNAIQANGISAAQVRWQEIEPMCMWLRGKDKVAYNRCRFDHIMNQSDFADDRQSCEIDSQQLYPDSLIEEQTSTTAIAAPNAHVFVTQAQKVSRLDLQSLRRTAITQCMRDGGWRSATNWKKGRVDR